MWKELVYVRLNDGILPAKIEQRSLSWIIISLSWNPLQARSTISGDGASLKAYGVLIGLEKNECEDLVSVVEEALQREDIRESLIKEYVERYGML